MLTVARSSYTVIIICALQRQQNLTMTQVRLESIFNKLHKPETTKAALHELYEFTVANPSFGQTSCSNVLHDAFLFISF